MQKLKEKLDIEDIEDYDGLWTWLHITTKGCFISDRRYNSQQEAEEDLVGWTAKFYAARRSGSGRAVNHQGNTVFYARDWINTITYPVKD